MEDLDFVDDLALLSYTFMQMQRKANDLVRISAKTGLRINSKKMKVMLVKVMGDTRPITVGNGEVEEVKRFTYLGSQIDVKESSTCDMSNQMGKARSAFNKVKKIWISNQYSKTKTVKDLSKQCFISCNV